MNADVSAGTYIVDTQHGWVYRVIDALPKHPCYLARSNGYNMRGGHGFNAYIPKDAAIVAPDQTAAARAFRKHERIK